MLSLSGHKFNGPKGIGALYVRENINFEKFMNGGHQERDKRAGTENVAGIVGIGKAAELADIGLDEHIKKCKNDNFRVNMIGDPSRLDADIQ